MITLKHEKETTLIIKKSRFIGYACRANNESDALSIIEQRKKQHYDARHNCFAWLLEDGTMRYSDDGEPQGTAGLPMLEVLKKSGLKNVLAVCTRYFGGTLLGAGGLVRAYTQSTAQTLEEATKLKLVPCSLYSCEFDFATFSRVQTPLENAGYIFDDITYAAAVTAQISVISGNEDAFLKQLQNLTQGQTIPKPIGQRRIPVDV
jgi:uncharacterized YigZ family protein